MNADGCMYCEQGEALKKISRKVAGTLDRLFHPDKLNYAVFEDLAPHFHLHLAPKYIDGPLWGKPYGEAEVGPWLPPDQELSGLAERIRLALPSGGRS